MNFIGRLQWASQEHAVLLVGGFCYFGLVYFGLRILSENCNGHHRSNLSFWLVGSVIFGLVYFGLRILSENCNGHHRSRLLSGAMCLSGWCILLFWLGLFFENCNGITKATYPSVLGVVNFCHDITGAISFWLVCFVVILAWFILCLSIFIRIFFFFK